MARKNFAATGSFIPEDRLARARPARLLEPARVQHVPQPAGCDDWEHARRPRARATAPPARTTGAWSSSARSTTALLPTCYVPLVDFERGRGDGGRGDRDGRRRAARRVGLPARALAEPPRPRPGVGAGAGGRHPGRVPRRRHRRPHRPATTSATACRSRPTSTAARRTSARSTTWASRSRPMQTLATMIFDGVLERFPELRIGVIEQGAIWVPSWMRQMESAFEAFAQARGAAAGAVAAPDRVRAPPDPVHAVPDRGRRLDHRAGRARGRACSRPTTRTSRAAAARSSASRPRSATPSDAGPRRLLPRQLPRPHGHRRRRPGALRTPHGQSPGVG